MSYKSGFFDAVNLGEDVYDRVYSAADFAEYFSRFVGNGVFASPANGLTVQSSGGMSISIRPGYAWINGYLFSVISGTTEALTVPVANPTMNRYDSVVLGLDYRKRQITPYIKSGTPASSPSPVALTRSNSLYEIEIARVYVATGASYVSQANIADIRADKTRCGFVTGLIDQIDTSDLFEQFQTAFTEWFQDLQDTLDSDTAANLLNRIQAVEQRLGTVEETVGNHEDILSNVCKFYYTTYTGNSSSSKSITIPFSPRRVVITSLSSTEVSGSSVYGKDELEILYNDSNYTGIFTRFWPVEGANKLCRSLSVSKSSPSTNRSTTLSWNTGSSTTACNESGKTYYVTAWGV